MSHAVEFGHVLRRAMKKRGLTNAELERISGIPRGAISTYRHGHRLPTLDTAGALADALLWPSLLATRQRASQRTCRTCGREYLEGGTQGKSIYCGEPCRRTAYTRIRRGDADEKRYITTKRLHLFEECVEDTCRACTDGEGVCRDESCPLRRVSPYRCMVRRVA